MLISPEALAAWRNYATKCAGKNFNPQVTSASTCAVLYNTLCSRKDVKCMDGRTQFLDPSGAVTATGEDESGRML